LDDFKLFGSVTPSCTSAQITSFHPLTGPQGTVVSINGSGFTEGTGTSSVTFNGIHATSFAVASDNLITAVVPGGDSSGTIEVTTDNCPSQSVSNFARITNSGSSIYDDLFISEVYDAQVGTGGIIEIYNGTGADINLSGYTL